MNPNNNNETVSTLPNDQVENQPHPVNQITPVSKYLAMVLFVLLPFVGGYVGYRLAPEKVVEVQKVPSNTFDNTKVPEDTNLLNDNSAQYKRFENSTFGFSFDYPATWTQVKNSSSTVIFESSDFTLDQNYVDRVVAQGISMSVNFDESFTMYATSSRSADAVLEFKKEALSLCGDCIEKREVIVNGATVHTVRKTLPSDLIGSPSGEYLEFFFINGEKLISGVTEYKTYSPDVQSDISNILNSITLK
jgi:hypothetical protein